MDEIARTGAESLVSLYKICLTVDGTVDVITQVKSSGFPAYDEKIKAAIKKDWRYRPYLINGKPAAVCTALRFIYSQR
jgi:outer membrane biosynthesis protein TonB